MISCSVNINVHNDFIMKLEKVLYLISHIYVKKKKIIVLKDFFWPIFASIFGLLLHPHFLHELLNYVKCVARCVMNYCEM